MMMKQQRIRQRRRIRQRQRQQARRLGELCADATKENAEASCRGRRGKRVRAFMVWEGRGGCRGSRGFCKGVRGGHSGDTGEWWKRRGRWGWGVRGSMGQDASREILLLFSFFFFSLSLSKDIFYILMDFHKLLNFNIYM